MFVSRVGTAQVRNDRIFHKSLTHEAVRAHQGRRVASIEQTYLRIWMAHDVSEYVSGFGRCVNVDCGQESVVVIFGLLIKPEA